MIKRVALITGCGKPSGLGAAIARELAAAGVAVAVTDIRLEGVTGSSESAIEKEESAGGIVDLVSELRRIGGDAEHFVGDVSSESDAQRMVTEAVKRFGRLDILVNNAAAPHGKEFNDIVDIPFDAYDRVMSVNTRGTFAMTRAAVPHMRRDKWGRIVNIASIAGRMGIARQSVYAASKAAIIGMTRCLAIDLGPDGITINAVCPGSMLTSRVRSDTMRRFGPERFEEEMKRKATVIPRRSIGKPDEVASVVAFLCSDGAAHLSGQAINVDGGQAPI